MKITKKRYVLKTIFNLKDDAGFTLTQDGKWTMRDRKRLFPCVKLTTRELVKHYILFNHGREVT